ncbi:Dynein assembly factor 3, axonemal, partial [Tetrabaena socialis]
RRQQPVQLVVWEDSPEGLARHLLLLAVLLDGALLPRERMELLLELHGNALLRERAAAYLDEKARQLEALVVELAAGGGLAHTTLPLHAPWSTKQSSCSARTAAELPAAAARLMNDLDRSGVYRTSQGRGGRMCTGVPPGPLGPAAGAKPVSPAISISSSGSIPLRRRRGGGGGGGGTAPPAEAPGGGVQPVAAAAMAAARWRSKRLMAQTEEAALRAEEAQLDAAARQRAVRFRIQLVTGDLVKLVTGRAKYAGAFSALSLGHRHVHMLAAEAGGLARAAAPGARLAAENARHVPSASFAATAALFADKMNEMALPGGWSRAEARPEGVTEAYEVYCKPGAVA